jgi:hypothetical protein
MAAVHTFQSFNESLSAQDQEGLKDVIRRYRAELLEARSEDARTRIVEGYIREVHDVLQNQ